MNDMVSLSRRAFLRVSGGAGIGFILSFSLRPEQAFGGAPNRNFEPNGWIRLETDGTVTLTIDRAEMGQGVLTALRMILAEEMDVEWSQVRLAPLPENPALWPREMTTWASSSVKDSWLLLRKAGAAAREMLIAAAALEWDVDPGACQAGQSMVVHRPSNRSLSYGMLAGRAATLPVPEEPTLKDPKDFRLIGTRVRQLDAPEKVTGKVLYGLDVKLPGMLVATILRSPVFGGRIKRFHAERALAIPGVRHVVPIEGQPGGPGSGSYTSGWPPRVESGLAVVADSYWRAKLGRDVLEVEWDNGPHAGWSSMEISRQFEQQSHEEGHPARNDGDAPAAFEAAARHIEAVYQLPYLHQATMEPLSCTADVNADGCEIWVGTQMQTAAQFTAAHAAGMPPERVRVHSVLMGGGFGRRLETDFVAEAVELSKRVGAPVKVIWSREDDVQHGFYRTASYHRLRAGLAGAGVPVSWLHRIVAPSMLGQKYGKPDVWDQPGSGIDWSSVEGARNLPYAIPNIRVELVNSDVPVPIGFWRSVGTSLNAYVTESFIDELAMVAGADPLRYRHRLLAGAPRLQHILDLVAEKSGWGSPLPVGRGRGMALARVFETPVAQVAEVTVSDGEVHVDRVVCAVDCGLAVNPNTVEAQIEGGVAFGLTAALYSQIIIEQGRVRQSNFHDYPLLRMSKMPQVEVHLVPSGDPPGSVGEAGVPAVAPAVCNAIYMATGERMRTLPVQQIG